MPTWAPLNDDPVTGDSIPVAFLELEGRTVELRKGFAGAAPPANPQEGQVWVDTAQSPYRVLRYLRIDAGPASWQPVGPLSRLPAGDAGGVAALDGSKFVLGSGLVVAGDQVVGARAGAIADPAGGMVIDLMCRAAVVQILNALRGHGLIAP